MKFVLLLSIALTGYTLGVPVLEDVETEWMKFKEQYGKQYESTSEEGERRKIFAATYDKIIKHNERYEQGLETYFGGINEIADMTMDEIKMLLGYRSVPASVSSVQRVIFKPKEGDKVPESIDWRKKGAVTTVKAQGYCGCCWAFSSVGSLEGQYFLKTGKLVALSAQNLIDCSKNDENQGCRGGHMYGAFAYVHDNNGIDSEVSYPYIENNGKCNYTVANNVTSVKAFGIIESGNENHLKAAVAQIGPISVAIDTFSILIYSGGIAYDKRCKSEDRLLNHAVLVVGYGTENGTDYWLVKNSYGTNWGVQGYFKMARNRDNNCGVATNASYPILY